MSTVSYARGFADILVHLNGPAFMKLRLLGRCAFPDVLLYSFWCVDPLLAHRVTAVHMWESLSAVQDRLSVRLLEAHLICIQSEMRKLMFYRYNDLL